MENKVEEKLTYDDRRKELLQKKSQFSENKTEPVMEGDKVIEKAKLMSTVNQSMEVTYTEDGIKLAYKNLSNQRTGMEQRISVLKDGLKEHKELPEDLKKLKEDIDKITLFATGEQKKLELEDIEKELKNAKKEIKQIKDIIGTRLKL